jgi:hypothetical protein
MIASLALVDDFLNIEPFPKIVLEVMIDLGHEGRVGINERFDDSDWYATKELAKVECPVDEGRIQILRETLYQISAPLPFFGSFNLLRSSPFIFASRASICKQIDCLRPCDGGGWLMLNVVIESSHNAVISNDLALEITTEKVSPVYGWEGGGHKPFIAALFKRDPRISPSHAMFFFARFDE